MPTTRIRPQARALLARPRAGQSRGPGQVHRYRFPARTASALAALLALGLLPACSHSVTAVETLAPVQVDSVRMLRVVTALAHDSMEGREAGTPGGARARRLLVAELQARGVAPLGGTYEHPFPFGRNGASEGVNVLGVIPGAERAERVIVASAHYDHVGIRNGSIYNGADDNASGTVALLELASWFAANPPRHTIVIAAFDAEEAGLRGARAFLADPPVPRESIVANVNMDMVGRNRFNELWAAGTSYYPQLRQYAARAARGARIRLRFGHDGGAAGEDDWTFQSDQGPFHQARIPFLYFGVENHPDYHEPSDDVERLQPGFFTAAAALIIDTVRRLDRDY